MLLIQQGIDNLIDLELNKFYEDESYRHSVSDKLIDNDYLKYIKHYLVLLISIAKS